MSTLVAVGDVDAEGEIMEADDDDPEGDDGALVVAVPRLGVLYEVNICST
jgi:hypothetical protein